ncbi:hypothetical protein [Hymenobacter sp. HDW8]|uniref:hypothetical protein n=1 Tax=Hymenobacter sp. HDW8 TaxID=2714932 RepID=UPI001F0E9F6A|nr:hypothetical protein [Hymenobacter sp. HDW8]
MPLRKLSYLTLLVLALLSALGVYYVAQLRFNYNFNDFYPAGDPDLDYYEQYSKRFGNDNDYVLIGLEAPANGSVFNAPFLARVDSFTRFAQRQRYVEQVTSPTTLTNPVVEGLGVFNIPYLHLDEPTRLPADSATIYKTPGLVGNLFATNGKAVTVMLQTAPDLKKPPVTP